MRRGLSERDHSGKEFLCGFMVSSLIIYRASRLASGRTSASAREKKVVQREIFKVF